MSPALRPKFPPCPHPAPPLGRGRGKLDLRIIADPGIGQIPRYRAAPEQEGVGGGGKRSWADTPSRVDPGNLISWPPPHPPPTPLPGAATCPLPACTPLRFQGWASPHSSQTAYPPPRGSGCLRQAASRKPRAWPQHCSGPAAAPQTADTMKSSGPVERLLRALGRRDSSRATSRVGVPTSWAEEGQGWRCGQWGRGLGDQITRPDPLLQPSSLTLHPLCSAPLGWPGQNRYVLAPLAPSCPNTGQPWGALAPTPASWYTSS